MNLAIQIESGVVIVFLIITSITFLHCILCGLHHCAFRDLNEKDRRAFSILAEVYQSHRIEVSEDLFQVEEERMTTRCWNRIRCIMFCLPRTPPRAKCPAVNWACLNADMSAANYVSQLAIRIDQALMVYQSQTVGSLAVRRHCCQRRQPRDHIGPHFPAFIVAEEWRNWTRSIPRYAPEAQLDLLEQLALRQRWLEEVETGGGHPKLADLQKSYGWDTNEEISLLKVFTTVVSPTLSDMMNHINMALLEKSITEMMKSAFYFSKRLITQIIRFFECILHHDGLRVKSFVQSHPPPKNNRWYFWAFLIWPQFASASSRDITEGLKVPDRDAAWRRLGHMDAVLLSWFSLINHLLLDDSTPDDESTYDVITRIQRRQQGFWYNFGALTYGFDYRNYQENFGSTDASNVEPIRDHHRQRFFSSMSAEDFGLREDQFKKLVDVVSFFLSRTLFATNQLATVLLLQASLPLIVGRLFTNELFGKQHYYSVLNFCKIVTDQLRYQIQEIKHILLQGWQNCRREQQNSHWSNLGPLDNFRLAMQAKKDIDKLLDDITLLMEKMRHHIVKAQLPRREGIEEVLKLNIEMYAHVWSSVAEWQNMKLPEANEEISHAPEWRQQGLRSMTSLAPVWETP